MSLLEFLLINLNLVIFYGLYATLFQRLSWLRFNRAYLLLMPVVAIVLPFISLFSAEPLEVLWVQELQEVTILGVGTTIEGVVQWPYTNWVYLGIAAVALLLFVVRIFLLRRAMTGKLMESFEGTQVFLLTNKKAASFSFLGKIYLSSDDLSHKEPILLHEFAHVKQKHTWDVLLMKLYSTIMWFNPAIYLWEKLMKENHEFLADRFVVEQSYPVDSYAMSIVSATFDTVIPDLGNGFNHKSTVRKRIERLKSKPKNQYNMKYLLIVPAIGGMLYLASCTKAEASESLDNTFVAEKQLEEPDVQAEFPGGMEGLMNYMIQQMKYPKQLESEGLEGKVMVEFIIAENGSVQDAVIIRTGGHELFDQEALEVVTQMPAWTPAEKDGKSIASKMVLPIQFKLQ